ncbi:MAG: nucleoside 2-deoxyribosyltransferase [Methanomicrobiaceae archaeon]|nr:nucleoside 2-deoxyribosyltransferase [Methanomicrobiaceae archaeon]
MKDPDTIFHSYTDHRPGPGYVLACPCIEDPSLRARGITRKEDRSLFALAMERCSRFGVEMVFLRCLETEYCGWEREPAGFLERLDTAEFSRLMDEHEREVRELVAARGPPMLMIGVDASPTCGVNATHRGKERERGRGAFFSRFSDIPAMDVADFARFRVYFAAPLFSEAERDFNRKVAALLSDHLFTVYLPQEFGDTRHMRHAQEHAAVFSRHIAALDAADIIVAVVDGADADSGTAWEMGYASASGKKVISLRTDFRSVGEHERVNLMLEQSSVVVGDLQELLRILPSPRI